MPTEGSAATGKPTIVQGRRSGRWDNAAVPHRVTKTFLKELQSLGYTRVRLSNGETHVIATLLRTL